MRSSSPSTLPSVVAALLVGVLASAGLSSAVLVALLGPATAAGCVGASAGAGSIARQTPGAPGAGSLVGATEYGGPGDPSSGTVGSAGVNLLEFPDSYAELGGTTFQTATALGGLPYETPLQITWGGHSVIAYKRDIGLGGGPIDGRPRVIDLWWQLALALGIPYEDGLWSGVVRVSLLSSTGASHPGSSAGVPTSPGVPTGAVAGCTSLASLTLSLTSGSRAVMLPNGRAAAPGDAPAQVRGMIAAGNEIEGLPYVYGGGHGVPLNDVASSYDCSSSVEHLLFGGGLIPVDDTPASTALESFGAPGPGRWVTIYANADHVFMYVAGLRWDTWNAAGPGDGSAGIGWHPLVRSDAGFVVRHPVGL